MNTTSALCLSAALAAALCVSPLAAQGSRAQSGGAVTSFYELNTMSLDGKPGNLAQYKGKVSLVVNVASKCGYTPQYDGLEKLHREMKGKGFSHARRARAARRDRHGAGQLRSFRPGRKRSW